MPNPNTTDYSFIISQGGIILDILPDTDLSSFTEGVYEVCGLNFLDGDAGTFIPYIGGPFSDLQDDLADPGLDICADLSDDCFYSEY